MAEFQIKKGKDLKIKGQAAKEVVELPFPSTIALQPQDFRGIKPRLAVKVGDSVKVGSKLFIDKTNEDIAFLSPASGTVEAITRGAKRALMEIVIKTDGNQDAEAFATFRAEEIARLAKSDVIKALLSGGLWPAVRQRPFSCIADTSAEPKSIFVRAVNTDPLAMDVDVVLEGLEKEFQAGLDALKTLTQGEVFLCTAPDAKSKVLTEAQNVITHRFSGPHPAGNVSTHIYNIDKIEKGDTVWYVEAQDVVRIGQLLLTGTHPVEKYVAVTGEGVEKRYYAKTIIGASIKDLTAGSDLMGQRCISGSVLSGKSVGADGYVCFYDSQVTIIPEGGDRRLLGWLVPGFDLYTLSNTYASAFVPRAEYSLDADTNGGERAIVCNHLYDKYVPLDIPVYFLLKAVIANDIESAEAMGILEVDEEDFALCTFACPSKTEVGAIIRQGLDVIQKEG